MDTHAAMALSIDSADRLLCCGICTDLWIACYVAASTGGRSGFWAIFFGLSAAQFFGLICGSPAMLRHLLGKTSDSGQFSSDSGQFFFGFRAMQFCGCFQYWDGALDATTI